MLLVAAVEVLALVQSPAAAPPARTVTRHFRRAVVAVCVISLATSGLLTWARGARADSTSSLVSMANSARASAGLPALAVSGDLAAAARAQAGRMAASQTLAHTANLPGVICCWSSVGENVGEGPSASALQSAFMASPAHRANILGAYSQIGVGVVVDARGTMWVSEIFRRPSGAPGPAPKPAPRPAPKPQPVVTHTRPATATPGQHAAAKQVPVVAPPGAAAATTRASRDLSRLPLLAAQRLAAQLAATSGVSGPDPVSRMLAYVAMNARLAG